MKLTRYHAVLLIAGLLTFAIAGPALAVTSVTVPGSFQSELGCPGDWMAEGACTHLTYDSGSDRWVGTFSIPAGIWEYKIAIDDSWTENYGIGGAPGGSNYGLTLLAQTSVTFTYDPNTHIVTNDAGIVQPNSVTLVGSLQSEAGCSGDWDPACATTHLALGGDGKWTGTYNLPAGSYEYKIAIDDSWAENYGTGGAPGGSNYAILLGETSQITFTYDPATHIVTSSAGQVVTAAGSFQSEVGCPGDWMPDCLNSQLIPNGQSYVYDSPVLPEGSYEFKITINQSWNENYGDGGAPGGNNLAFTVPNGGATVTITYNPSSHVPSFVVNGSTAVRRSSWGKLKMHYR